MFRLVHVDEINHDNAAHVAQSELAGNLVGSPHVYFKGVCLLIGRAFRSVARVDIDNVERLGVFDDDVGT